MANLTVDGSLDAVGLAELVRRKEVTPLELVEAAIGRVEALNPRLNAIVRPALRSRPRRGRRGAAGRPVPRRAVPLKSILADDAGTVTTNGSRLYWGLEAEHDSELVRRYKAAGLVIIGKTNVPEFGLVPITSPSSTAPRTTPGRSTGPPAAPAAARARR